MEQCLYSGDVDQLDVYKVWNVCVESSVAFGSWPPMPAGVSVVLDMVVHAYSLVVGERRASSHAGFRLFTAASQLVGVGGATTGWRSSR